MAGKKSNTRAKRAADKISGKALHKKQLAVKEQTQTPSHTLPSVLQLSRSSILVLLNNKKLFGGIIVIYGLLNILFVGNVAQSVNFDDIKSQFNNTAVGSIVAYSQLLGSSTGAPDQASGVYQLFLNIFVSLALIWALRQVYAKQIVRIRDAYYLGMQPLIPFILLLLLLCVQLLPFVIGTALYQFAATAGIADSPIETIIWLSFMLAGAVVSAYWVTRTIIALFLVTLPDMQPWKAFTLAKKLTAGRRWTVLRKLPFMPLLLLLITAILLLPLILLYAPASRFLILLLIPATYALAHSYVYAVYRELIGE